MRPVPWLLCGTVVFKSPLSKEPSVNPSPFVMAKTEWIKLVEPRRVPLHNYQQPLWWRGVDLSARTPALL